MQKKWFFSLVVVIFLGLGVVYFFFSKKSKAFDPKDSDSEVAVDVAENSNGNELPGQVPASWKIRKFWEIHHVAPKSFEKDLDFVVQDGEKISEWFHVEFENEGKKYLVFLTKVQTMDESGELHAGSGQVVQVGAGLYRQGNQGWELVLVNDNLGEYGAYGDVPEVKDPQILDVAENRKAVVLDNTYCNHGECSRVGSVIEMSVDRLEDIGTISLGDDNLGQCDEASSTKCYKFTSQVESIPDGSKEYFDLVIKKTGKELDDKDQIVNAHDVMVVYRVNKYEEMR